MSTATLEAPTALQAATELPSLEQAFADAGKELESRESSTEPVKAPVKEKEGKAAEPVKPDAKQPEKAKEAAPVKEAAPTKGKSALDAILGDETAEAAPEPDEVTKLIESKDPNWDKARETMKTQSARIKEFEAKLAKPELPANVAAELAASKELKAQNDKLNAENAKMRDSIMALDVRFDPAVQEKIQGREGSVAKLAASLKDAGADADLFVEAMALPIAKRGKHIDAILEGIESSRTRSIIERKLADIEVMDEQLDEMVSQPHKSFEELKQQREIQAREHEAKVEQFKQATFEKVQRELPKLSKLMRPAPADSEGAKEYNETLQADLAKAPALLEVEPEKAAQAAYMAARYPTVEKLYIEGRAKIAELEAYVAKLEGAEPGHRGGGKDKPKQDYERPLGDVFTELLEGQRGV